MRSFRASIQHLTITLGDAQCYCLLGLCPIHPFLKAMQYHYNRSVFENGLALKERKTIGWGNAPRRLALCWLSPEWAEDWLYVRQTTLSLIFFQIQESNSFAGASLQTCADSLIHLGTGTEMIASQECVVFFIKRLFVKSSYFTLDIKDRYSN